MTTATPRAATATRECSDCHAPAPPRKRVCAECGGQVVTANAKSVPAPPLAEPVEVMPSPDEMLAMLRVKRCRSCEASPAVDATFRSNTGMVIAWRMTSFEGPWCRDCGTAVFRQAMNHTLMKGWFGFISFFANMLFIAQNLIARARVQKLASPTGGERPPVEPGAPLFKRPGIYVAALVFVALGVYASMQSDSELPAGDLEDAAGECVRYATDDGSQYIAAMPPCSEPHDGKVLAVVPSEADCPAGTTTFFTSSETGKAMCVNENE